jgi:Zn-dependent peptidase ImmA (M78 family)
MTGDAISIGSAAVVAARLREARLAAGLSTRTVAGHLLSKFNVRISHTALANYEKAIGGSSPPVRIIALIGEICERPLEWFLQESRPLTGIRYRYTSSRVLVKERHQFEAQAQHWLEAYDSLERRLRQRLIATKKIADFRIKEPIALAQKIRSSLDMKKREPIFSVVGILESFGIRVIELATPFRIDGLTARFGDEIAVVLNPSTANDRCRLNAAHELYHGLSGDCDESNTATRDMENRAFEFACNLLIPQSELEQAFDGLSAVRLVQAKEHFGISMAAMIYRAEKLGIINERLAKKLWIQFAKRGWRAKEPGSVRPDRAIRFETILDKAITARRITWTEAAALMSVTRPELEDRMRLAMGIKDYDEPDQKGGTFTLKIRDEL